MTTYAISTLGCKVNSYESQSISQALRKKGYEEVSFKELADIYLIFTCAVTNTASSKSRQKIHQAVRQNPDALICAVGCYVQINAEQMRKEEHIDLLIGSSGKDKIPDWIEQALQQKKPQIEIENVRQDAVFEALPVDVFDHQTRAYLKIQDGCNQFCTYCIIPYARGKERSMPVDQVLQEAKLLSQTHQEIVLAGIHTGRYGNDMDTSLAQLLKQMSQLDQLKRIRISSIEITEISDELLELMQANEKIARHLHIPVQSGCDSTLQRMGRPYTTQEFLNRLEEIRRRFSQISISTDLIVGFPGESEEEMNQTLQFLKEARFSFLHVFPFSAKTKTRAMNLPDQLSSEVKKQRVRLCTEFSKNSYYEVKSKCIGQEAEVLIETCENGISFGHSSEYLPIYISEVLPLGSRVVVCCTHLVQDQLYAEVKEVVA